MPEVPDNPVRELERQHPSLAQPVGSATAAIEPRAQPDAGVAEHGLRARAGQPSLAASATRAPVDAASSRKVARQQQCEFRQRRGSSLEGRWPERLGHAFDCLARAEARFLTRTADAYTVRHRFAKAQQGGSGPGFSRNPGRRLNTRQLTAHRARLGCCCLLAPPARASKPSSSGTEHGFRGRPAGPGRAGSRMRLRIRPACTIHNLRRVIPQPLDHFLTRPAREAGPIAPCTSMSGDLR